MTPRQLTTRAGGLLVALFGLAGRVAAHAGESHDDGGVHWAVPAAVFLGSVLVLGTAVYLEHEGDLDRRWADVGVTVGVVGLLASFALLFV